MKIIPLSSDPSLLSSFLKTAGDALKTFRYYDKRPLSVTSNHVATLIGKEGDTPVSYGHLDKDGDIVWLGICVSPMYQGKGLGSAMMAALIAEGSRLGIKKIRLGVYHDNASARTLYEKFGFVEDYADGNVVYYELQSLTKNALTNNVKSNLNPIWAKAALFSSKPE